MARETYKQKYMKEYKQFYKRLKRLQKRGYEIEDRYLPKIPQKIGKKEYERIKNKNTLDYLYDKSTFYDVESDKMVSGKRGREIERSRAGKKAARTRKDNKRGGTGGRPPFDDVVLREIESMIEQAKPSYKNPHGKDMLKNLLFEQIAEKGRSYVAKKFYLNSWVKESAERVLYDSNQFEIQTNFNAILVVLTDNALTPYEMSRYYDSYNDEGWN